MESNRQLLEHHHFGFAQGRHGPISLRAGSTVAPHELVASKIESWDPTQLSCQLTHFALCPDPKSKRVCLKIGYIPNYSHLIGIMISKTIGFRGTNHFQTHPKEHLFGSTRVPISSRTSFQIAQAAPGHGRLVNSSGPEEVLSKWGSHEWFSCTKKVVMFDV